MGLGMEFAEQSKQDYVFLKVDFDYDMLEWSFILQALKDMGFGCPRYAQYVSTLFGNARAKVSINERLSKSFSLCRSIRQGCPLVPLLFAIVVDCLNC